MNATKIDTGTPRANAERSTGETSRQAEKSLLKAVRGKVVTRSNGGGQSPPTVDKGVINQNSGKVAVFFRLHWLTFTIHAGAEHAREMVINRVLNLPNVLPDEFFKLADNGSRGYQKMWIGLDAIRIYFEPSDESKRFTVEIPGEALEKYVSHGNLQNLFSELDEEKIKWKCTRLDLAFDMPENSTLTPGGLNSYLRYGGDLKCFSNRKTVMFISPVFSNEDGEMNGSTLYIGSRTSERFLRVYDKRGFTRIELELKKKIAHSVFSKLIHAQISKWAEMAKSYLLGYVDFPDHSEWDELIKSGVIPAKIELDYLPKTLARTRLWINKSVAPSLAMLAKIGGLYSLVDMVTKAESRLTDKHLMLIENANGQGD